MRTEDYDGGAPRPWATMRDWLDFRLKGHLDIDAALAEGRFVLQDGTPLAADAPYRAATFVWFHRDLPDETPVPGEVEIIYRDDRIVVVDKPPFLSSIPRGKHIVESVVVRMRSSLGLPELTPMHRLDRVTSGLLVLTTERRWRGAYQSMFMRGEISKRYRAIAPLREDLEYPAIVRSHLTKRHGVMRAERLHEREPNSESVVELEAVLGEDASRAVAAYPPVQATPTDRSVPRLASYRLTPRSGKTHQLRMHMLQLGIPIVGDPLYPVERDVAIDDFSTPLQLLASELSFTDPVDGRARHFVSGRAMPLRSERGCG